MTLLTCVTLAPAAMADSTAAKSAGPLDEVRVTAQRRSEDSQQIPVAVTSLSAADLSSAGVVNTVSLSLAVPGLMYMQGANTATPFIRGVGSTTNSVGAEGAVSTYIDGVYVTSLNATLFELNNVERVEVLKGPQGTLFGRNATGGVVQIVTKDPSFTPSANLQIGYGNFDTTNGSFYGTTGLGNTVALDLAAYGRNQAEGWGTALATGQPTFTRHDFGGRSKLLWARGAGTRVVLAADYNRARNEDGLGYHLMPSAVGIDGVSRYSGFYNTYDAPNDFSDVRQTGLSVTAEQDFSRSRLVSITSWRNVNGFMQFDQDSTPRVVVRAPISQHDRSFTKEVQLLSRDDAPLQWIVGLYYFHDLAAYDPLVTQGSTISPLDERQVFSTQKSNSYAGFGQLTREIANDTHLTVGARYTRDERAVAGSTLGRSGTTVSLLSRASQNTSWSKATWRVALDHRFTPSVMAYASADRGFKSGIYNLTSYAAAPVRPETLDAYQLGLKSEFDEHHLRLNAAAFYYRYKGVQLQKLVTGATLLINAAGAVMKGLDVDFTWVPVEALAFRGGFEWMSGHYTSFRDAQFFSPVVGAGGQPLGGNRQFAGDATDLDTVRTPKRTATVGADYRLPMLSGELRLSTSYSYNSGFAWDPDNRLRQPAYDVVNASAAWSAPRDRWGVQLWARNLTAAEYCLYAAARPLLDSCSPAPPRTYGVTFTTRYPP